MIRRLAAAAALAAFLAFGLILPAAAQNAQVSTDPQLRRTAEALLVWTMIGIDQARQTGNYSVLRTLFTPGGPGVRKELLAKHLSKIKGGGFAEFHDHIKRFPQRLSFSRLQKLGTNRLWVDACYCPEGYHLYFEMRYRKAGRSWTIDLMKVWDVVD